MSDINKFVVVKRALTQYGFEEEVSLEEKFKVIETEYGFMRHYTHRDPLDHWKTFERLYLLTPSVTIQTLSGNKIAHYPSQFGPLKKLEFDFKADDLNKILFHHPRLQMEKEECACDFIHLAINGKEYLSHIKNFTFAVTRMIAGNHERTRDIPLQETDLKGIETLLDLVNKSFKDEAEVYGQPYLSQLDTPETEYEKKRKAIAAKDQLIEDYKEMMEDPETTFHLSMLSFDRPAAV